MIKLDAMENPYRAARPRCARSIARGGRRGAGQPLPRRRCADGSSAALRRAAGIPDALGVLLGNGSDELIQIITSALARPGAAMLAPEPSFVMYRMNALYAGMRYVGVPLARRLRARHRRRCWRRSSASGRRWCSSPIRTTRPATCSRPPTSSASSRAAPGLVVVDEAYYAFADASFLPRVGEFPNLLVLRTVSKIGMAGLRLGYAVAAPAWIDELDKVRQPYNLNALTQAVAPVLLAEAELAGRAGRARSVPSARGSRPRLGALPGRAVFPTQTNFVLVRVPDAPRWFAALREAGILVKNLHGWHPLLEHCLRITVGHAGGERRTAGSAGESTMSEASHSLAPARESSATPRKPGSASRSTSTAPAAPSSPPACRSSTTCSTRSRATG